MNTSTPARVWIFGSGLLGSALQRLFSASGLEVQVFSRHHEQSAQQIDISRPEQLLQLARSQPQWPQAMIHAVSSSRGGDSAYRQVYVEGVANLLQAFPGVRLLLSSSSSVYADSRGEWVDEQAPLNLKREAVHSMLAGEQLCVQHGGIALRLAGLYGKQRCVLLSNFLQQNASRPADLDKYLNVINVADAARAMLLLLQKQAAAGVYNLSDGHPLSYREIYQVLLELQPDKSLPQQIGSSKRGNANKRVSNAKLCGYGWQPRWQNFASWLEQAIKQPQQLEE